jgi:hypothetical protein
VHLVLGEDERAVVDDVELPGTALPDRRLEPVLLQLGRETRGPSVVAASDRAIQDLDAHERSVFARAAGAWARRSSRKTGLSGTELG